MKISGPLLLLAFVAQGVAAAPEAGPAPSSLLAVPLITLEAPGSFLPETRQLELGMDRAAVLEQMGGPSVQLEPSVWLYARFRAGNVPQAKPDDALIVVFHHDRVSLLRLASRAAVRATLTRQNIALPAALGPPR